MRPQIIFATSPTVFIKNASDAGIQIISGYELFFYQGIYAWEHFSGLPLDHHRLRLDLLAMKTTAPSSIGQEDRKS
ncbi:hypothetical protein C0081_11175 [Cohaesibacter celericrescens]|uniref:Uncharacterized protein n=1 Tax=Cohaesibacter celericrescens TaxID=2067669 RepID=A0A2N5XRI8_9HYPH|nr:hypothetical protein C0081_11175 [Cohaesibacter celericrescens]